MCVTWVCPYSPRHVIVCISHSWLAESPLYFDIPTHPPASRIRGVGLRFRSPLLRLGFLRQTIKSFLVIVPVVLCISVRSVTEDYTYLQKLCFTTLVQPEVFCLKQSEYGYYTFRCIDSLAVTKNQMILTIWCIGKSPHRNKKEIRNYDVDDQH